MKCGECDNAEATIHLTQVVDNKMTTYHLCEACAAKKGLQGGPTPASAPLTDFLAQMGQGSSASEAGGGRCSGCGLSVNDFKRSGRLGCAGCYRAFEKHLRGLFRRLHGGTQHVGKVYLPPDASEADRTARIASLRRSLRRAVDGEDFERAASLRDEIREMEGAA